jgi:hypothetical protein
VVVAGLALGASAGPASANDAGSVLKTAGNVSANVAWDAADVGVANPRLTIVRAGVRYDPPIADICETGCVLVADDPTTNLAQSTLKVADLDGDGEPEILVDTFSGGAHCCVTTRMFYFDGVGYVAKDTFWGDVSYQLVDLDGDGRLELSGYDPRFSAAFTAYAASAFPPLVYQVSAGSMVDVTRRFPAIIEADAAARLKDLRRIRRRDDRRGILAAYVADQYLLGRGNVGLKEIAHQRRVRANRVSRAYRASLLRRLKTWGYRARG